MHILNPISGLALIIVVEQWMHGELLIVTCCSSAGMLYIYIYTSTQANSKLLYDGGVSVYACVTVGVRVCVFVYV